MKIHDTVSELLEPEDDGYEKIASIARTLVHVAATETIGYDKSERTSAMIAAMNAGLIAVFVNGIKPEHMRQALESMITTMRINVDRALEQKGYRGP